MVDPALRGQLVTIAGPENLSLNQVAETFQAVTETAGVVNHVPLPLMRVMAKVLSERGVRIVSGGTDSHLMLVDLRAKGITGKDAEAALGRAYITVNKNAIPDDPEKPTVTSGIRIGSPAMTTRGFEETEAEEVAHLIVDILDAPHDEVNVSKAAGKVRALTAKFPVYG